MADDQLSQVFLAAFCEEYPDSTTTSDDLSAISHSLQDDLGNTSLGYFSHEDWNRIVARAGKRLAEVTRETPGTLIANWHKVLREFHSQSNWGHAVRKEKPKTVKSPSPTDGLLGYIWVIFQAMAVTKMFVLVYGAKYSNDPHDTQSLIILCVAVAYMFLSPAYFVWRKNRKK